MYLTFVRHHWKPSDYYKMGPGQRLIVRAFLERETQDLEEAGKGYGK
nr:MAG TPA: hypothetical protein [Caudoviricetes sp.]